MKKLVLATFIAALTAGFQALAVTTLTSLPIGSVERVLNHELANTHQIVLNVEVADNTQDMENWNVSIPFMGAWRSYTKADGSEESVNALCQRAAATSDKTELKALLQTMMREAVRVSFDPNDPALQGKVIAVAGGAEWALDPNNYLEEVGTLSIKNIFVLGDIKDSQGKTVIPESAYEVDMEKAITRKNGQGFFIDNIAKGEIRNIKGDVIESGNVVSWLPNKMIGFNNTYIFGQQAGTIQLWYTDGTTQTFSLDGSLISLAPILTIAPVAPSAGLESAKISQTPAGVKVRFVGPLGTVNLEYTDSFDGNWLPLATLQNYTGSVEFVDVATNSARFYRAHLNVGGN